MKWLLMPLLFVVCAGCVTHVRKYNAEGGNVRLEVLRKDGPVESFPLGGRERPFNFYFKPRQGKITIQEISKITRGFPPDHEVEVPKESLRGEILWEEKTAKVKIEIEQLQADGMFSPIEVNGTYKVKGIQK